MNKVMAINAAGITQRENTILKINPRGTSISAKGSTGLNLQLGSNNSPPHPNMFLKKKTENNTIKKNFKLILSICLKKDIILPF